MILSQAKDILRLKQELHIKRELIEDFQSKVKRSEDALRVEEIELAQKKSTEENLEKERKKIKEEIDLVDLEIEESTLNQEELKAKEEDRKSQLEGAIKEEENLQNLISDSQCFIEEGAGKKEVTERGVRVPLIARCPGTIPAGRVADALVSLADVLPTLVEWSGSPLVHAPEVDGTSLVPTLLGKDVVHRPYVYSYLTTHELVRDERWLLDGKGRLWDCGESREGIIALLGRQIRQLWQVRRMKSAGASDGDIAAGLGMRDFAVRDSIKRLPGLTDAWFARQLSLLSAADYESKASSVRAAEGRVWLENLLVRMCER